MVCIPSQCHGRVLFKTGTNFGDVKMTTVTPSSNRTSNAHNVTRTYLIGGTAVVGAYYGCMCM